MRTGELVIPSLIVGGAMKINGLSGIRDRCKQRIRAIYLGTSKHLVSRKRAASIRGRLPEKGVIDYTLKIGCKDLSTPGQRESRNGQKEEKTKKYTVHGLQISINTGLLAPVRGANIPEDQQLIITDEPLVGPDW